MAQREQIVADLELKLQEREEQDDLRLKHELEALASHESDLSSRGATLGMERKDQEVAHVRVLACELAANVRDEHMNSKADELADREKRLVEREQQLVGRQLQ
jgi:hypothetical protein